MNNLIDKYIYNVRKHLPEKIRLDVKNELNANIYDMLPDNFSKKDVMNILNSLGDPEEMAEQYRIKKRYVVSPQNYEKYMLTLNISIIVTSISFFFLGSFYMLQKYIDSNNIMLKVLKTLSFGILLIILAIILSYAIVTFVFHMISIIGKETKKKWTIEQLEELPKEKDYLINKKRIYINVTSLSIVSILGLFLLIFCPEFTLFKLQIKFDKNLLPVFIPMFVASFIFLIIKTIIKVRYVKITYLTTILDTIYDLYTGIILIVFLLQKELFQPKELYWGLTITLSSIIGILILIKLAIKWYRTIKNY